MPRPRLAERIFHAASDDLSRLSERHTRCYRPGEDDTGGNDGWCHETTYKFKDGDVVTLASKSANDLIFPASPGFVVLLFEAPDGEDPVKHDIASDIDRSAVIGWTIEFHHNEEIVIPITTEGFQRDDYRRAFRAVSDPDGRLVWLGPLAADSETMLDTGSLEEWITLVRGMWSAVLTQEAEEEAYRKAREQTCSQCGRPPAFEKELEDEIPF